MGFESYGVTLRGGDPTFEEAIGAIANLEHARPDPESELTSGSRCYLVKDGKHAIELEVMNAPVTISCRFTLCHPSTVDAVFIALVKKLMAALDMSLEIFDHSDPRQSHELTKANFDEFASIISDGIMKERKEWKAAFGSQTLGATTVQVHERIIAPHYQSQIEKAG